MIDRGRKCLLFCPPPPHPPTPTLPPSSGVSFKSHRLIFDLVIVRNEPQSGSILPGTPTVHSFFQEGRIQDEDDQFSSVLGRAFHSWLFPPGRSYFSSFFSDGLAIDLLHKLHPSRANRMFCHVSDIERKTANTKPGRFSLAQIQTDVESLQSEMSLPRRWRQLWC